MRSLVVWYRTYMYNWLVWNMLLTWIFSFRIEAKPTSNFKVWKVTVHDNISTLSNTYITALPHIALPLNNSSIIVCCFSLNFKTPLINLRWSPKSPMILRDEIERMVGHLDGWISELVEAWRFYVSLVNNRMSEWINGLILQLYMRTDEEWSQSSEWVIG